MDEAVILLVYLSEQLLLLHTLSVLPDGGGRGADLLLQPRHYHLILVPQERLRGEGRETQVRVVGGLSSDQGDGEGFTNVDSAFALHKPSPQQLHGFSPGDGAEGRERGRLAPLKWLHHREAAWKSFPTFPFDL